MNKTNIVFIMILVILVGQNFTNIIPSSGAQNSFTEDFTTTSLHQHILSNVTGWGGGSLVLPAQKPVTLSQHDTPGFAYNIVVDGDYIYVADGNEGLYILNQSNINDLTFVGNFSTDSSAVSIDIKGSYVYIGTLAGLIVLDVSDPANPTFVSSVPSITVYYLEIIDSVLYSACSWGGLRLYNISNPASLNLLDSHLFTDAAATKFTVEGTTVYVALGTAGLGIIDANDESNLLYVNTTYFNEAVVDIVIEGSLAYVGCDLRGFHVLDISNPHNVSVLSSRDEPARIRDVEILEDYIFFTAKEDGVWILDKSTHPTSPTLVGVIPVSEFGSFTTIHAQNEIVYIVDGYNGVIITSVDDPMDPVMNYYASKAVAVSNAIFYAHNAEIIQTAVLSKIDTVPTGTTIEYFLSADGGTTWELITPLVEHSFINEGRALTWRAILKTQNISRTPVLNSITVNYTISLPRAPELYTPLNMSTTNDSTPSFDWESFGRSDEFVFQLYSVDDPFTPIINETVFSNSFLPSFNLSDNVYGWRVATIGTLGVLGPFSDPIIFGVNFDPNEYQTTTTPTSSITSSTTSIEDSSTYTSFTSTTDESVSETIPSTSSPGFGLLLLSLGLLFVVFQRRK